ncbi:MAG: type II secretion system minor pseudopilin GspJ [Chromatocurvus sp.]
MPRPESGTVVCIRRVPRDGDLGASKPGSRGFTLVEVLIALAVTAFVAAAAYAGVSTVISGVESTREVAERTAAINRALALMSRDIRQFVDRGVRDEFGQEQPGLSGGRLARFPLTLTRAGWHNSAGHARSTLERVAYVFEDGALWRLRYPVLDRAGGVQPARVLLLEDVEGVELRFLRDIASLRAGNATLVETRDWETSWVADVSQPGLAMAPPAALELRLELADVGLLTRLYALPPN